MSAARRRSRRASLTAGRTAARIRSHRVLPAPYAASVGTAATLRALSLRFGPGGQAAVAVFLAVVLVGAIAVRSLPGRAARSASRYDLLAATAGVVVLFGRRPLELV